MMKNAFKETPNEIIERILCSATSILSYTPSDEVVFVYTCDNDPEDGSKERTYVSRISSRGIDINEFLKQGKNNSFIHDDIYNTYAFIITGDQEKKKQAVDFIDSIPEKQRGRGTLRAIYSIDNIEPGEQPKLEKYYSGPKSDDDLSGIFYTAPTIAERRFAKSKEDIKQIIDSTARGGMSILEPGFSQERDRKVLDNMFDTYMSVFDPKTDMFVPTTLPREKIVWRNLDNEEEKTLEQVTYWALHVPYCFITMQMAQENTMNTNQEENMAVHETSAMVATALFQRLARSEKGRKALSFVLLDFTRSPENIVFYEPISEIIVMAIVFAHDDKEKSGLFEILANIDLFYGMLGRSRACAVKAKELTGSKRSEKIIEAIDTCNTKVIADEDIPFSREIEKVVGRFKKNKMQAENINLENHLNKLSKETGM